MSKTRRSSILRLRDPFKVNMVLIKWRSPSPKELYTTTFDLHFSKPVLASLVLWNLLFSFGPLVRGIESFAFCKQRRKPQQKISMSPAKSGKARPKPTQVSRKTNNHKPNKLITVNPPNISQTNKYMKMSKTEPLDRSNRSQRTAHHYPKPPLALANQRLQKQLQQIAVHLPLLWEKRQAKAKTKLLHWFLSFPLFSSS